MSFALGFLVAGRLVWEGLGDVSWTGNDLNLGDPGGIRTHGPQIRNIKVLTGREEPYASATA
jgi:hypothetical protein